MRGATESICEVYQILFARSTNSVYSSNLHATSLSLIVPSEPPCYSFISVHSIFLCPLHVVGLRYDFIFREKLIYDTLTKNQLHICQCPIFPLYLQLNGIAFA